MNNTSKTRALAECAVLIALGTILAQIKIYEMPNGGSITAASMVPFVLISLRHGPRWGMLSGFANSLLQMLLGGLWPTPAGTATAMALEVVLDYLVPFSVLGLAWFFAKPFGENRKMQGILFGTAAGLTYGADGVYKYVSSGQGANDVTGLTLKNINASMTIYAAGYVIITDGTAEGIIYTEEAAK